MPFYPFLGEGSPTRIDYRKKGRPYSNLSTGGPSPRPQDTTPSVEGLVSRTPTRRATAWPVDPGASTMAFCRAGKNEFDSRGMRGMWGGGSLRR